MKLRAELIIESPDARRTVLFHDVGVNQISQYCSIGLTTLQERVRDRAALSEIIDTSPTARRTTVNRDGYRPSLGRLHLTFRLGTRTRTDYVYIIPGTAQLQIGCDVGQKLRLVEALWEVSSDSDDSSVEAFMREFPIGNTEPVDVSE